MRRVGKGGDWCLGLCSLLRLLQEIKFDCLPRLIDYSPEMAHVKIERLW